VSAWTAYLLGVATVPALVGLRWLVGATLHYARYNMAVTRRAGWIDGIEPRAVSLVLSPYLGVIARSGRGFGVRPPKWWTSTLFVPKPLTVSDGWPAFHLWGWWR